MAIFYFTQSKINHEIYYIVFIHYGLPKLVIRTFSFIINIMPSKIHYALTRKTKLQRITIQL